MLSDSESDDDVQIKKYLEASDTSLFNNSMFHQDKETNAVEDKKAAKNKNETVEAGKDLPKSQRFTIEDHQNPGTDFYLPESMQKYLAKKLNQIMKQHYEFYEVNTKNNSTKIKTKHRNRVKLLKGADCFVNSYEDFEYQSQGPKRKPIIKRRILDYQQQQYADGVKDALKFVAVDGNLILSGEEVETWAKKKERRDKVFHYKLASNGTLHAQEEINEFSELRRKNKWNENKIKHLKKSFL